MTWGCRGIDDMQVLIQHSISVIPQESSKYLKPQANSFRNE